MERTDRFFEAVNNAGLGKAFNRMSDISFDTLDCYLEDLIDDFVAWQEEPQARIRYEKKDGKEFYICEIRMREEDDWMFESSWELQNDMIHFTALTKIRELKKLGYRVSFK